MLAAASNETPERDTPSLGKFPLSCELGYKAILSARFVGGPVAKTSSKPSELLSASLNASNDSYLQPNVLKPASPDKIYGGGLTIGTSSKTGDLLTSYNKQAGFYGVAFEKKGQLFISYEGTNFFTKDAQFTAGQVVDDADIVAGQLAPSFTCALKFEKYVLNNLPTGISASNVYLTGHSLGAADCEYVSAKTGMSGITFGTPGISTNTPGLQNIAFHGTSAHLTNYVDNGDPVGNYAIENTGLYYFPAPISDIVKSTSPDNQHFGTTEFTGYNYDPVTGKYDIGNAGYAYLAAADEAYTTNTEAGVAGAAAGLAAAVPYHSLTTYAEDLGVTLGSGDHSYGASPVCFAAGTRIRTPNGDRAIETLEVGDLVVTSEGRARPIRWLGHRVVSCHQHPNPRAAWPVRIAKDSFAPAIPARDLLVSPGHSICVDAMGGEVLVPASTLVDGTMITQVEVVSVTYWHVELDDHDVIVAEGLKCESYLDMGNRGFFAETDVVMLCAAPDTSGSARAHDAFCRPFHASGPVVAAVRLRLAARSATLGYATRASRAA